MRLFSCLAVIVLGLLLPAFSQAGDANDQKHQPLPCPAATLKVCGQNFTETSAPLGTVMTFNLPERFLNRTFAVQCVNNGGASFYQLTTPEVTACVVRSCQPGSIDYCGLPFSVPTATPVGETTKVVISPTDITKTLAASSPSLSVECVMEQGQTLYRASQNNSLSCNAFLCQAKTFTFCGHVINLPSTAEMGAVLRTTSTDGQAVTVQCLGSNGKAPQYQVTDRSALNCP